MNRQRLKRNEIEEMREEQTVVVYVPSGAKRRMFCVDGESGNETKKNGNCNSETYVMSGALPRLPNHQETLPEYVDTDEEETSVNKTSSMPNGGKIHGGGRTFLSSTHGSTTLNSDYHFVVRQHDSRRTCSLRAVPKPRDEVIAHMRGEMHRTSVELHDPDKVREGSTSGWLTTLAIMSGLEDDRYVLPILTFIKVHEVKDMKKWLIDRGCLQRSGSVSRIERVLHFIFALQMGCRLEMIAVMFSRSPRQVER